MKTPEQWLLESSRINYDSDLEYIAAIQADAREGMVELQQESGRFTSLHACQKCGMPGATLHFPGGWLCPGGCKEALQPTQKEQQ